MAFYQNALATVKEARELLAKHKVPYKRPEDFFCDMLKSDEHMARVSTPVQSHSSICASHTCTLLIFACGPD